MYIKPSNPVLSADRSGKSFRANKKTESGAESFKDLLEEIDIVELSSELDPDEKRKKDLKNRQEDIHKNEASEVTETKQESIPIGINRFV